MHTFGQGLKFVKTLPRKHLLVSCDASCCQKQLKNQLFQDSLAFYSEITYWVTEETHSGPNIDAKVSGSAKLCRSSFTVSPKIDAEN